MRRGLAMAVRIFLLFAAVLGGPTCRCLGLRGGGYQEGHYNNGPPRPAGSYGNVQQGWGPAPSGMGMPEGVGGYSRQQAPPDAWRGQRGPPAHMDHVYRQAPPPAPFDPGYGGQGSRSDAEMGQDYYHARQAPPGYGPPHESSAYWQPPAGGHGGGHGEGPGGGGRYGREPWRERGPAYSGHYQPRPQHGGGEDAYGSGPPPHGYGGGGGGGGWSGERRSQVHAHVRVRACVCVFARPCIGCT